MKSPNCVAILVILNAIVRCLSTSIKEAGQKKEQSRAITVELKDVIR